MYKMLRQIGILTWKNLIIMKRHWVLGIFELLIPILLFALIALLVASFKYTDINKEKSTYNDRINEKALFDISDILHTPIYFAPDNDFTSAVMNKVADHFARYSASEKTSDKIDIKSFPSEKKLELAFNAKFNATEDEETDDEDEDEDDEKTREQTQKAPIGIIFINAENDTIPKHVQYKIRSVSQDSYYNWETDKMFAPFTSVPNTAWSTLYFQTGFLSLQIAIDSAVTDLHAMRDTRPAAEYSTQLFPYPPYSGNDRQWETMFKVVSLMFCFSFFLLCLNMTLRIVREKHTGVTELMKMVGLSRGVLWFTWFLRAFIDVFVIVAIIVLFLSVTFNPKAGAIVANGNPLLIWIFCLLVGIAIVVFVFALSTFLSRPVVATCCVILAYLLAYFVPVNVIEDSASISVKLLACLLPTMAMHYGWVVVFDFEKTGDGIGFFNFGTVPQAGGVNILPMTYVLLMLIVDVIIYGLITFYVDAILPGKYGVGETFYFLCTKSYWCNKQDEFPQGYEALQVLNHQISVESPPPGSRVGIRIQNLSKKYRSGKLAVDDVSMDIYDSHITALLGHNGAGKTTLLSVITGVLPSSSGNVYVNNYNIRTHMSRVRENLMLCPQENLFFPDLTVTEHLVLFGMIKGLSMRDAKDEALYLLNKMQLTEKADSRTSALSGGMKRKLSLGIALIGGSKVVILDEPTSGLDPQSRRQIWDLLLGMRGQRTIVITTHFMEEADALADRIAIMDHGRLQCYGTPMYLKRHYGAGYVLKLMVKEESDLGHLNRAVQSKVKNATLKSRLGAELSYTLPLESKPKFSELFDGIESSKSRLGINSMGLALTTLEDVFLRVGTQTAAQLNTKNPGPTGIDSDFEMFWPQSTGARLVFQQMHALFVKKVISTKRTWKSYLLLALIAFLIAMGTVSLGLSRFGRSNDRPALWLSLKNYSSTTVVYSDVQSPTANWYGKVVRAAGSTPLAVKTEDIPRTLLDEGKKSLSGYREHFVVAAEFVKDASKLKVTAMYSYFGYHGVAISVNLAANAVLKAVTNSDQFSITTINHPFTPHSQKSADSLNNTDFLSNIWSALIPFGMLFFVGYFLIFPSRERVSYNRQLQYLTGVSPISYWLTCFFCDLLVFTIVASAIVMLIPILDRQGIMGGNKEISIFALSMFLYGLCGIPFAYCFSYFLKTTASCFGLFIGVNILIGEITEIFTMVLSFVIPDSTSAIRIITWLLMFVFPPLNFRTCLHHTSYLFVSNAACMKMSADYKKTLCLREKLHLCCGSVVPAPYFAIESDANPHGVSVSMLMFCLSALFYLTLAILMDCKLKARFCPRTAPPRSRPDDDQPDADVRAEIARVYRDAGDENVLAVTDLRKRYTRRKVAVVSITFGVLPGECFGLLGVNGAGKTTTFQMLTGNVTPSGGEARIDDLLLSLDRTAYLLQIGYCPQLGGLNESLTSRETLTLFARLRGIRGDDVKHEVARWISLLGLDEYQDVVSGAYSGGNKRKLSTAIALIGDPPLIFLDEPTSGVDPASRRNLWQVLKTVQETGASIVLTSHSMDECEALCNRLAIMVDGRFMCLGEVQHLKQKFGRGFTVQLRVIYNEATRVTQVEAVKKMFERRFPGCVLRVEAHGLLEYRLTDPNLTWGTLFAKMEALKEASYAIEDYTVTETPLEEVFLSFAKTANK